jgi:hypothetical protein
MKSTKFRWISRGFPLLAGAALLAGWLTFPTTVHAQGKSGTFIPLWYEDELVTALLVRSSEPGDPNFIALPPVQDRSNDNLYVLTNPNPLQPVTVEIIGSVPGDAGYTGGRWNVKMVTFSEALAPAQRPIITSEDGVEDAVSFGLASVADAGVEFECPVVSTRSFPASR